MMKFEFPRPATYLTILALTTLTISDCKLGYATQPADAIQVDADFVPYVLTSMASLVPSPFADPASLNNPLGVEHSTSPRNDAMRSIVSQSPSRAVTPTLDATAKEPAPKISLPHGRDFTFTTEMTTSIEPSTKEIAPWKNSIVMNGR